MLPSSLQTKNFVIRHSLFSIALCSLTFSLEGRSEEKAKPEIPIHLNARLKDGAFIRGRPKDVRKLTLDTVLGPVEIPFQHIVSVTRDQDLFTVNLVNSMRLKGKVSLKSLPVASQLGEINLPVDQIVTFSISRPLPAALREGLVLHYDFENVHAGKVFDLSGNGNHGRLYGTTLAPGINGSGAKFEPRDYIDAGDAPSLKVSQLTVAAWVWQPFFKENRFWIQKGEMDKNGIDFGFQIAAGRGLWFITNHGNNFVGGNTQHRTFPEKWHHIAATWDDESKVSFYLDGKLSAIEQAEGELGPIIHRYTLKIGRWNKHNFIGRVDEVTLYNRMLSSQHIKALAEWPLRDTPNDTPLPPPPVTQPEETWSNGMVAWLSADGHSLDRSQYNHPIHSPKIRYGTDRHNWPESSFEFTDKSAAIQLPDEKILETDEAFTLSAWIQPRSFNDGVGGPRCIISKWHSALTQGEYILEIDKGRLRLRLKGNKRGQMSGFSSQGQIPLNEWTHVAVTFLRGRVRFYYNAKPAGQYTSAIHSTRLQPYQHDRIGIGALSWQTQNQFDGHLDDIRIHNRALSNEEIEAMMNHATARRIRHDDQVWTTGRTNFEIQKGGLHSLPEARKGFPYGVEGRGPFLSTRLGDTSWKDFSMDFDFLVKGPDPNFDPHDMPDDWAGIHFLFRVQNHRENWLEKEITAYRLSFMNSGDWEFQRLHNIQRIRGKPGARGRNVHLGKGKIPKFLDKEHHLNVQAIGGSFKFQLNDNFQIQINDGVVQEGASPLLYGGFVVQWAAESMGSIRNFKFVPLNAF